MAIGPVDTVSTRFEGLYESFEDKLSRKLMHYMLYEGNLASVPLRKEIAYLENYLELERIRYGDELHLSFTVTGPISMV